MTKQVLIADQSKPNVVIISEILKDKYQDVSIILAEDGRDVLRLIKKKNIDLLIMEFFQPDVDGVEVAKRIKKTDNHLPIIFTTVRNDDFIERFNEELFCFQDCSEIQFKPIQSGPFEKVVDRYLSKKGRIERRFELDVPFSFKVKHHRTRKMTQVRGTMHNMSLSGFCISNITQGVLGSESSIEFELNKILAKRKRDGVTLKGEIKWVDAENKRMGGILKPTTKRDQKVVLGYLQDLSKQKKFSLYI